VERKCGTKRIGKGKEKKESNQIVDLAANCESECMGSVAAVTIDQIVQKKQEELLFCL
jgi:hypothetical protein